MKKLIHILCQGETPFCLIQKQDDDEILLLSGTSLQFDRIKQIPRKKDVPSEDFTCDTISIIPFRQIRERGYTVHNSEEKIRTIEIDHQQKLNISQFLKNCPREIIHLEREIQYDSSEQEYIDIIEKVLQEEIGNGEGANFVIPRNGTGKMKNFSLAKALTIFSSLVENDYGTYWKFLFYDREKYFIGSTPERHLLVNNGDVKMNPISGTFRKEERHCKRSESKKGLLTFLNSQKEINELFMVVDEELKMMAKMCTKGGSIIGPILKEMSSLIHSEYLLSGKSDKDIFDLFIDSMFAATVVGSPVENSCRIIKHYSQSSRRYYGSAMMLVGRDVEGKDFLDAPITIRTVEIDTTGDFHFSVGATLVKDSAPEEELLETKIKSSALLSSILKPGKSTRSPRLMGKLYNDDEIVETLVSRNKDLSHFWFFNQDGIRHQKNAFSELSITIIHNEDDFSYMLRHMFTCMGISTTVISFTDYNFKQDTSDITLIGPGPGDPNNMKSGKIKIITGITQKLLSHRKPALFICLGHQILCRSLGFELYRKEKPLQGSQVKIDFFGREELAGFYNTFAARKPTDHSDYELSTITGTDELAAIRNDVFIGYQFHPESLLSKNGYVILQEAIIHLTGNSGSNPE